MSAEPWEGYDYTALIVFCFLLKDDKILLIKRANNPYKGEITIPGGRKRRGESLKAACAREMMEETGYSLKKMEFAGILHVWKDENPMEYVSHYFVCRDFEGELRASDEGELSWVEVSKSTTLPGIHPFYVALLPYIVGEEKNMGEKRPFSRAIHVHSNGREEWLEE
ncbi:MAG: NUDIX domain-containing protein [Synergistaceae bacterium]|jgi:8-oxo-dGTP diphosphatase|nr:NUDIX domain-containing protein [Synergistaceae bacterium]